VIEALHSLSHLSMGVKISIAIVGVIVIAGLLALAHFYMGASHARSEYNGDQS
jgi:hypothetical protein